MTSTMSPLPQVQRGGWRDCGGGGSSHRNGCLEGANVWYYTVSSESDTVRAISAQTCPPVMTDRPWRCSRAPRVLRSSPLRGRTLPQRPPTPHSCPRRHVGRTPAGADVDGGRVRGL
uniref:NADH-ubiquinone oxidoreductase 20 kDa subunit n=1 Tax=Arundo donax TaxID=35708 RepID=A0A0A9HKY9_ARUDO